MAVYKRQFIIAASIFCVYVKDKFKKGSCNARIT